MSYTCKLNIEDEDLDKEIYRVMPIHRMLEILDHKELTLVNPERWDDPFENLLLKNASIMHEGKARDFKPIRDAVYGQCWTLHKETDAMWRIYSRDKQGVKVKTTIRKLIDSLQLHAGDFARKHCFIGKVKYLIQKDLVEKLKNINISDTSISEVAESLIYKRKEFQHEKEVRLIYTQKKGDVFKFTIDPDNLFDEVIFDPRIGNYLFEAYRDAIQKRGYKHSIRQSVLYRIPKGLML